MDQSNRSELGGTTEQNLLRTDSATIVSESKSSSVSTAMKAELCVPESKKRKLVNTYVGDYALEGE